MKLCDSLQAAWSAGYDREMATTETSDDAIRSATNTILTPATKKKILGTLRHGYCRAITSTVAIARAAQHAASLPSVSSSKILSSSIVVGLLGIAKILLAALAALLWYHRWCAVRNNYAGRAAVCEAPRAVAISNERGHEPVSTPTTTSAVTRPSSPSSAGSRSPPSSGKLRPLGRPERRHSPDG